MASVSSSDVGALFITSPLSCRNVSSPVSPKNIDVYLNRDDELLTKLGAADIR